MTVNRYVFNKIDCNCWKLANEMLSESCAFEHHMLHPPGQRVRINFEVKLRKKRIKIFSTDTFIDNHGVTSNDYMNIN